MKRTNPKKLTLSRETLTALSHEQAKGVQGGAPVPYTSPYSCQDTVRVCCS
jgi:hypothetical protein